MNSVSVAPQLAMEGNLESKWHLSFHPSEAPDEAVTLSYIPVAGHHKTITVSGKDTTEYSGRLQGIAAMCMPLLLLDTDGWVKSLPELLPLRRSCSPSPSQTSFTESVSSLGTLLLSWAILHSSVDSEARPLEKIFPSLHASWHPWHLAESILLVYVRRKNGVSSAQQLSRLEDRNCFKFNVLVGCGMHTYNPSTTEAEAGFNGPGKIFGLNSKFLDYRVRIFLKTNKSNQPNNNT